MSVLKKGLTVFVLVGLLITSKTIFAQESQGFAISPPSFDLSAVPGDIIPYTIKIENLTSNPLKLTASRHNFAAYGDEGQVEITDEPNSYSIGTWLKFSRNDITIPPKETAEFSFEITIPKNAEPGSHYGAIVFSTDAKAKAQGSGAILSQQIGSLILIRLPGDVYENAAVLSFEPAQQVFKDPKITLKALIENTGNVHIKPYGSITIKNILGMKSKTVEVSGKNVLPGSRRAFEETFKFDSIGWYTADLKLLYSGGGKVLNAKVAFVALNQQKLIKYGAITLIVLVLYLLIRKRLHRAIGILIKGK